MHILIKELDSLNVQSRSRKAVDMTLLHAKQRVLSADAEYRNP